MLLCQVEGRPRDLLVIDLSLYKRVNRRLRLDTPSTAFCYQWYVHNLLGEGSQQLKLGEFILNAALVRATLSFEVRVALKNLTFVWLLYDKSNGRISNLEALDEFAAAVHMQLFGDFVNPQRSRNLEQDKGYLDLVRELSRS